MICRNSWNDPLSILWMPEVLKFCSLFVITFFSRECYILLWSCAEDTCDFITEHEVYYIRIREYYIFLRISNFISEHEE